MNIKFEDEAYESFQRALEPMEGYGVEVKTLDGEVFDAELCGPHYAAEWGDAVMVYRVNDDHDRVGDPFSVRVEKITVF